MILSKTVYSLLDVYKRQSADRAKKLQERKEANDKKIQELKEAAAASGKSAKPGSLADKVGMVSRYNEVNDKRK